MNVPGLPFVCLRDIFCHLSLRDQLVCVGVWPELTSLLHTRKYLRIVTNSPQTRDDVGLNFLFWTELGYSGGLARLLDDLINLETLDVSDLSSECQEMVLKVLGLERRPVKVLHLGWCQDVTPHTFRVVVDRVRELRQLRVTFYDSPDTDAHVSHLLASCPALSRLDLSRSGELTSEPFRGLPCRLTHLDLRKCSRVSIEILHHLLPCQRTLEEVNLAGSFSVTPQEVPLITRFHRLRVLHLPRGPWGPRASCPVPRDDTTGLASLASLSQLQELYIDAGHCLHDPDLRALVAGCPLVRTLHLATTAHRLDAAHTPSAHALASLSLFPALERVKCEETPALTDDTLAAWGRGMARLKELRVAGTGVTVAGLRHVAAMEHTHVIACDLARFQYINTDAKRREMEEVLALFSSARLTRRKMLILEVQYQPGHIDSNTNFQTWRREMAEKYTHSMFYFNISVF